MTVEDYQEVIDDYKRKFGKKYFEENEGYFWGIHETRPFMQCLLDQAHLLWDRGEKERAIDQFKYILKLNPRDNQGVRDTLFPHLLELNRLDEAYELYLEFEEDSGANMKYNKLLLDIKRNAPFSEIKKQYRECVDCNPHVVPFLTGDKDFPLVEPSFYSFGDENEAIFYIMLSVDAWLDDVRAMEILWKLSKK